MKINIKYFTKNFSIFNSGPNIVAANINSRIALDSIAESKICVKKK